VFAAFVKQQSTEVFVAPVTPRKTKDGGVGMEQSFTAQIVQRWYQLTPGRVTVAPKITIVHGSDIPNCRSAAINSTHCHDVLLWCLDSRSREYDVVYPLIKRQGWLSAMVPLYHPTIPQNTILAALDFHQ
jgi:hypothetical protein